MEPLLLLHALRLPMAVLVSAALMLAACRLAPHTGTWRWLNIVRRVALVILFFTVFTLPSWVGDENTVLMFLPFLAVLFVCVGGDRLGRLVLGGMFYCLLLPLNMATDSLIRLDVAFYSENSGLGTVLKAAVWCVFVFIIRRTVLPGGLVLSRRLWGLLGALTLAPLGAMLSLSLWSNHWADDTVYELYAMLLNRIASTVLPAVFISAVALLFAAVRFSRHEAMEHENRLAALREVYYDGVRQEQTQVRGLRHDLRNHLAALQGLLARGETAQADAYVTQLTQMPALMGGARFCENEVANVVLSCKAALAQDADVCVDFSAALPEPLPLPAPELCALLGNALDNAIEAARCAQDKTIVLRARAEMGLLMVRVENAVDAAQLPRRAIGTRQEDAAARGEGLFSTTKQDAAQHGFGLTGMRDIAQRHGGSLEAKCENERFTLLVCVPLEEQGAAG